MSERYTIKGKIGQGGVGSVYRAFDSSLKRDVAIKRLHADDDPERSAEKIVTEAGMLSRLQHPNIVTVYDVGTDDDGGYVVMELIEGETFDVTISRGALTAEDFSSVVDQTLEALIAAQQIDMLHRDLKPSNVMVSWLPSGRFQVKILDFGLAKLSKTPALQTINHGDAIMGSIYFMAPEQFDRELLDARTDLYSLGCLYYFGLTGRYPFDGDSAPEVMMAHIEHDVKPLGEVRQDIPQRVCDWVMRLISKDKEDRPATASEAAKEFAPLVPELGNTTPEISSADTPPPPSPNRPQLITGPVGQLPNYTANLHTTGYQMRPKKDSSPAAFIGWAIAAIATIAGAIFLFSPKSDKGLTKPPTQKTTPPEPSLLIAADASWRYLDRGQAAMDWYHNDFDDSDWKTGKAPLGYGDPMATELHMGPSPRNKRITHYFRQIVQLDRPLPTGGELTASIRYDDGFVIYLNGKELARQGMPAGKIAPNTLAATTRDKRHEKIPFHLAIDPRKLEPGRNVFAAEVHQASKGSSDLAWAMELNFDSR